MVDAPKPEVCIEIFCSYSHTPKDEALRAGFENAMKFLVRSKLVRLWHDGRIRAGDDWAMDIDEHLNSADIVALLVSPDFLASDYCYEKEMSRALERRQEKEAVVVPIIVRDCIWKETPLAQLQAIPAKALPVTSWKNRDQAWTSVIQSLAIVARELVNLKLEALEKQAAQTSSSFTQEQLDQFKRDREEANAIYAQIIADSAANAEERKRIQADMQRIIFAAVQDPVGYSVPKKGATNVFNDMEAYIRGE